MSLKEQFNRKLEVKGRPERLLEEPAGYRDKVKVKCLICGEEEIQSYDQINKRKKMCHSGCKKITLNEYLESINSPYRLIGDYKQVERKTVFWCEKHKGEFTSTIKDIKAGYGCGVCYGRQVNENNSLYTIRPDLLKFLSNEADAKTVTPQSHKTITMKCPICGTEKAMKIQTLSNQGFSCSICSDNFSLPEKYVSNILQELQIAYIPQYSPTFANKKRYDFYIPDLNLIIETHGKQHYVDGNFYITLEEQQSNDRLKKILAIENGINNYIEINCSDTSFIEMTDQIKISLEKFIDFSTINFELLYMKSQDSKIVEAWNLFKATQDISFVSIELKISKPTIRKYIKLGKQLNML